MSSHLPPFDTDILDTLNSDYCKQYVIQPYEIERRLSCINLHKSPGPDGLPNWFLRDFAPILSEPLAATFNASLRKRYFPPIWKSAEVVPIPKMHPSISISNDLCHISLVPTLAKLFESFVGRWLVSVLDSVLDNYQFGCRRGRSTVHAVTAKLHTWMSSLDSGGSVRAVFVDFRKAFDLVNHNILFHKLLKYNVPNFLLWFGSYLLNRLQRV